MNNQYQKNFIYTALCVALNIGLAKTSSLLALPFTMDTIGTILAATILPWHLALLVGGVTSLIASIVIHPAFLYYVGTQIVIAIVALGFVKLNMFSTILKAAISGLIIGIASAVVSAPVTAIVFGGIAVPSITALNALFLASGSSLWTAVLSGALIVESIDKVVAGIIACLALKRIKKPV